MNEQQLQAAVLADRVGNMMWNTRMSIAMDHFGGSTAAMTEYQLGAAYEWRLES